MPHPLLRITASTLSLAALAAGALAYAELYPRSQLLGSVLIAPRRPRELALTFDDGPNPTATPRLLDLLAEHRIQATFFLVGSAVRQHPQLARRILAEGHVVGNHTMTHPWLPLRTPAQIRAEITGCNRLLEDTLSAPVRLFRPPHGARTRGTLRHARALGLTTVNWNVIVNDWEPVPAETILARLQPRLASVRRRGRAANLVLHDGGANAPRLPTVEAVRRLIPLLPETVFVTPAAWLPA